MLESRSRTIRALRILFAWLWLLALTSVAGCYAATDVDSEEAAAGVQIAERYPTRQNIEAAMDFYYRDPQGARTRGAMSVDEYFGSRHTSSNENSLRVELLKPNPRFNAPPIAFLRAKFFNSDMYWNNRYKDVQLYRLVESTGTQHNPFPEAKYVPHEGSSLVRMWTDYRGIDKGAPKGLDGLPLMQELARIAIWSYVSGNVDGPATNANNGGFARFKDPSGREFWRGVLIDAGAAWNMPEPKHQPWNTNFLGRGPVKRDQIPEDVVNSLIQIARGSAEELAKRSKFDNVDEGAKEIVRGQRIRAQQVLDRYGIQWKTSRIYRLPARTPQAPAAKAA